MKLLLSTALSFFLLSMTPVHAADAITKAEMEAIVNEGMIPEVVDNYDKSEAYSRKYYAPTIKLRTVNTMVLPNLAPQKMEKTYNNLEELIASGRRKKGTSTTVFITPPTVSGQLVSFKYDDTTKKADVIYTSKIAGDMIETPGMHTMVDQTCRVIAQRQEDATIKMTLGTCNQTVALSPKK